MSEEILAAIAQLGTDLLGKINAGNERIMNRLTALEGEVRHLRSEHSATRDLVALAALHGPGGIPADHREHAAGDRGAQGADGADREGVQVTPTELRGLLERLGLSQVHVARLLGVTDRTVRRWTQGEWEIPGPAVRLLWLCEELPGALKMLEAWQGDAGVLGRGRERSGG